MLTIRWKYKKLKQIEGSWKRLGHFHRTRSQAFACVKMASAPKKPRQTSDSSQETSGLSGKQNLTVSLETIH